MLSVFEHYLLGQKLYEQVVSKVYKKYNLTYMEFTIIMFLFNNPQFDTASDIVKYRCLTKSHVSTSVKSLVEKKLLLGEFTGRDRKSIHLKLTNLAKPIAKEGQLKQQEYVNLIYQDLTSDDKQKIKEIAEKVNKNIQNNLEDYNK